MEEGDEMSVVKHEHVTAVSLNTTNYPNSKERHTRSLAIQFLPCHAETIGKLYRTLSDMSRGETVHPPRVKLGSGAEKDIWDLSKEERGRLWSALEDAAQADCPEMAEENVG
jgi:hypothetical protein